MSDTIQPIDAKVPDVSEGDVKDWLKELSSKGHKFMVQMIKNATLDPESFNPEVFEGVKKQLALARKAQQLLIGVIGDDIKPASEEMDEEFFAIISRVYGYDVRYAKHPDPVKAGSK